MTIKQKNQSVCANQQKPMNKNFSGRIFILLVICVCINACTSIDVYFQYSTLPDTGWNKDSVYHFNVDINDISAAYNVYVNVRNRGDYPHQNLWLFIKTMAPDSVIKSDTINFYLADQRGKWLGSGIGSVYDMPVLYEQEVKFTKPGSYQFSITHGMRDSILAGVNDIGLRIEKK